MTPIRIGIITLTLATALIHLTLNFPDVMFILNGLGYLGLLAALIGSVPIPIIAQNPARVRWALIAFAAITILGWLAIGERTLIGYLAKAIEVALIVLIVIESRQK